MTLRQWSEDTLAEASGMGHRVDPVLPGSGGPAGNARLTAWTGLVLLVLFVVELATLLNLGALLSWHIVVGVLLVPPALLKTGSTGWRIIGYYGKRVPYRQAGPPPMFLRVLGPLVVLCTLAVLGSGLALIALGPVGSFTPFAGLLGYPLSALMIHKVTFIAWAVVTGLHTLGRLLPAMRIVTGSETASERVPGRVSRGTVVIVTLVTACIAAAILLGPSQPWL